MAAIWARRVARSSPPLGGGVSAGFSAGRSDPGTSMPGMKAAAAGKVWDEQLLDAWLTDTQSVAPGNAMTYFEGDEARRQKIIAYLRTLH